PAWLIAWEWVIFLVGFCLVRQLARTDADNRGLLAALVASAVCLSAYAVYQYTVELPNERQAFSDPEERRRQLEERNIFLAPDDPQLEQWQKRIEMNNAFATYAHPNSFAGFLVLLIPPAAVWTVLEARRSRRSWRLPLAAGCVLLMAVALWMTHSRGALG